MEKERKKERKEGSVAKYVNFYFEIFLLACASDCDQLLLRLNSSEQRFNWEDLSEIRNC